MLSQGACTGRDRHGMTARARLHTRNASTEMHDTGCACRCFIWLVSLRRSAASTRPALVVDCGIFRKLPCLQTRYIVERAADASLGTRIDPAQPLASVRGVCRKPASYSMNFDLLRILEPSKKAGLRIPAHFLENAGSPGSAYNFKCVLPPASCFLIRNLGCCGSARKNAGSQAHFPKPGFLQKPTFAMRCFRTKTKCTGQPRFVFLFGGQNSRPRTFLWLN